MVLALLSGAKTQTRRALKLQPDSKPTLFFDEAAKLRAGESFKGRTLAVWGGESEFDYFDCHCPYGGPGDELFVKETWRTGRQWDALKPSELPFANEFMVSPFIAYDADGPSKELHGKTRPSIFMPKWASRITLEIESVRVERLCDISEEDAKAEGVGEFFYPTYSAGYMELWEKINGPRSWAKNPWVWVLNFRKV